MSLVVWLTGLSGAGKSTIAALARRDLQEKGFRVGFLDGDLVRRTVTGRLGFSPSDIEENNRVIAGLCLRERLRWDLLLVAVISPFERSRQAVRARLGDSFALVYVKASLAAVMERDPKGLYRKAREGILKNVVGYSPGVPYEAPDGADLVLDTERESAEQLALRLAGFVQRRLQKGAVLP